MNNEWEKVLYHKGKGSELRQWRVWTEGAVIKTEYGVVNGELQQSSKTATPKKVGTKAATTGEQQAILEAKAMYEFKRTRKYSETRELAEEPLLLPMLAKEYRKEKTVLPGYIQRKFDGCFTYKGSVTTDVGNLPIGRIVEEKLNVKILSFNEETREFEYKQIKNWFNNGKAPQKDWVDLEIGETRRLRCTGTHRLLTNNGWKEARNINSGEDKILSNDKSSRLIGMLFGTLLGDSSIATEKRGTSGGYRLMFSHTNFEYLDFKVKTLNLPGKVVDYETGYGSKAKRFTSSVLNIPELGEFFYLDRNHDKFGQRIPINSRLLSNWLTREGLAYWIGDDGAIRYNNRNKETPVLTLNTQAFTETELGAMISYFKDTWGVSPSKSKDRRLIGDYGLSLIFNTADTVYLLSRLRKVGCKGVEYKFFFKVEEYQKPIEDKVIELPIKISKAKNTPSITKYDIEVEDNHNYVINGIIAHNCRLISLWDNNSIKMLSRSGKEITVPKHIAEELSKILPKGSIVDGELYNHGVTFQEVVRRVKKWRPDTTPLVEYHIYDMPSAKGQEDLTFTERLKYLQEFLPQKRGPLVPVETIEIYQHTEIEAFEAKAIAEGYEGAIVRNAAGLYLFGYRNQDLMKVKTFDDAEFKVVDVIDGIGKFEGKACFICQNDLTDDTFECTMATSMEEKAKQFENKDQYIGKMLTVKFFRRTEALLPRFCVGLRFRPEEDLG